MLTCGYRGILAIEFFVKGREFFFNEMAPRPHNSGHYTIEGCTTNQFRELVRFLLGEPLQEPRLVAPTVMKNILGQDLEAAEAIAAENRPGVHVRLYGKTESRPSARWDTLPSWHDSGGIRGRLGRPVCEIAGPVPQGVAAADGGVSGSGGEDEDRRNGR